MINFKEILLSLPPESKDENRTWNRNHFLSSRMTIIVLDDDPTGTQTMFDVPVLTTWGKQEIQQELENDIPLFFILTNSRSLVAMEADKLAMEIGENCKYASEKTGRKVLVISRGDSTLRGHYPNEVDALATGLGTGDAPHILIPAFFQGGRYTINDTHYVHWDDELIPAAETPFARDATFGYTSSDLKDYVVEKSGGSIKKEEVISISIEDLRLGGTDKVIRKLDRLKEKRVCVVNAVAQSDLDIFVSGFYHWQENRSPVVFRTAASILPSLAGVNVKKPFEREELKVSGKGGVVAVGSYVSNTTEQLEFLKQNLDVEYVEINAENLVDSSRFNSEIEKVAERINSNLENDKVVVAYTSRTVIKGNTPEESLYIVNQISKGMVETMKAIRVKPRFFIAKGGITSSDIATKAFGVKRAHVLGQIIPGVPIWKLDDNKAFEGLLYMPFPGNLGGRDAVLQAINKLI